MVKIPYFGKNYMNKHIFHKILYSFEAHYYKEGEMVLFEGEKMESVIFVVDG
jgi:hypothetical protein